MEIGIIGGNRGIGAWFAKLFEKEFRVKIASRTTPLTKEELVRSVDVVIVSVPISATAQVIEEILPLLKEDQLLMDFTSLKVFPLEHMRKHKGEVVGLHPLFGPLVKDPEGETIIVVKERPGERWQDVERFFEKVGFNLVEMDAHEHDRLMAIIQNILHLINYSFMDYIAKKDPKLSTPVFLLQKYLGGRILSQNPQLYFDMGRYNPYTQQATREYLEIFQNYREMLEKNDPIFLKNLEYLQEHFKDFIEHSKIKTGEVLSVIKEKRKEKQEVVGYLGPQGSFTYFMAKQHFSNLKPFLYIKEIFKAVEEGSIEWGVVPAENTLGGYVNETYDNLIRYNVKVVTSFYMNIRPALLSVESSLDRIKKIVSHPKAIQECSRFVEMLGVPVEYAATTTERLSRREPGVGYIAHPDNAQIFRLNILARDIQDHQDNVTEFYVIGTKEAFNPTKTLFAFSIMDRKGALKEILEVFKDVNLSKIFSRPARLYGLDYVFFVEAEFKHKEMENKILKSLKPLVHYWKVAGYTNEL